jgi:hypothetical protein
MHGHATGKRRIVTGVRRADQICAEHITVETNAAVEVSDREPKVVRTADTRVAELASHGVDDASGRDPNRADSTIRFEALCKQALCFPISNPGRRRSRNLCSMPAMSEPTTQVGDPGSTVLLPPPIQIVWAPALGSNSHLLNAHRYQQSDVSYVVAQYLSCDGGRPPPRHTDPKPAMQNEDRCRNRRRRGGARRSRDGGRRGRW